MFTKFLKLLFAVGVLFLSYSGFAQPVFTVQNVKGSCDGFNNGSMEVLVTSATGTPNVYYFVTPFLFGPFPATVGVPLLVPNLAGAPSPGRSHLVVVQDDDDQDSQNVLIVS
jgi:hypothetical protein